MATPIIPCNPGNIPQAAPKDPDIVDIDEDYEEEFIFECGGVPFFAKGDIHAVTGKVASGRFTFELALTAAAITGKWGAVATTTNKPIKCLLIDTDQGSQYCRIKYNWLLRQANAVGLSHEEIKKKFVFLSYNLSGAKRIADELETLIKGAKPDLVIIDNLSDLVHDITQYVESNKLVRKLKSLANTYDCAICCSIHLDDNAELEDGSYDIDDMEGWLGSILAWKADDAFVLSRGGGKPTLIRHAKDHHYKKAPDIFMRVTSGKNWGVTLESRFNA